MLQKRIILIAAIFLFTLAFGCTSTVPIPPPEEVPSLPPYQGPKIKANVVEFGISKQAVEKYPELKEKRVGLGLCNRIVETFYESGYFELVEEKEAIKKRIMDQWLADAVFSDSLEEPKGLTQPEMLFYAEVYDFGIRDASSVKGIKAKNASETWVTIQVRAVMYSNGEFVPATGTGQAYAEKAGTIWGSAGNSFDASCIGKASEIAVQKAIFELIARLQKKGFFSN